MTLVAAGIGGATLYYILRNMSGPVIKNDFLEQALGQVCPCLFASPGESHYHNPELECITALFVHQLSRRISRLSLATTPQLRK